MFFFQSARHHQKYPLPWSIYIPFQYTFPGPTNSPFQTASQSVQPFGATVCKTVLPTLSDRSVCPVCLSVTLVYCAQTIGWIKMKLGMEVGLGPGHMVLDGDPAPLPKRGTAPMPQFSAHVCCGQAAGWIKMPLGMEVGLGPGPGPGDIVLDGDPAPQKWGHSTPNFGPCLLWPNGWMDPGETRRGGWPRPTPHSVRWGPSSSKRGTAPQFSAHVCCGQTAGWMKMSLGMEVGLAQATLC